MCLQEVKQLKVSRHAIVNVWAPIQPVLQHPLALCEYSSLSAEDICTDSPDAEQCAIMSNSRHAWHFFHEMRAPEALVFKTWDSLDSVARWAVHSAVELPPDVAPDATPRHSVEVRVLLLWLGNGSDRMLLNKIPTSVPERIEKFTLGLMMSDPRFVLALQQKKKKQRQAAAVAAAKAAKEAKEPTNEGT